MADGDVDFGRDGSARNVGASPGESTLARKTVVIPRTNINCCILDYNCIITRLKCQYSGGAFHIYECY